MSTLYMHAVHKSPLYVYSYMCFFLDGAAQSPRPLLRFTPGFAAVRRRKDLATLGLFWGALPDPPDPPETPTKGIRPRAEASLRSALSS